MAPRRGLDLETVVEAAAELADSKGLECLTIALLAEKLNVRSPSLYNHVAGLPELKRHLVLYGYRLLRVDMGKATAGKSGEKAIMAFSDAYLAFARQRPGLYELTLGSPPRNDEELQKEAEALVGDLLRILQEYGLSGEEGIHAVRGLRSLVHGFASIEQKGGFGMPIEVDSSFTIMMEIYLAGISERKNRL
ncbi:TetR/AcrR family transcriptional regulator [Paenibacillus sp. CAU 1782]